MNSFLYSLFIVDGERKLSVPSKSGLSAPQKVSLVPAKKGPPSNLKSTKLTPSLGSQSSKFDSLCT